ncbi:MAG: type II CRISPR-associated endonuclease Cas1 [Eubacteriales bacterium]
MSWRTVVITKRCKLDVKLGYLVVRDEETSKIFLDEIALLVIENPAVSLTVCLLEALKEKKIKTVFCDSQHLPMAELVPYSDCYDDVQKVKAQIRWSEEIKDLVWAEIIRDKISKQAEFLDELNLSRESRLLRNYSEDIAEGDITNREGHAAKVYFNALFGKEFTRGVTDDINAALNYGYTVIMAMFSREITSSGYLTQLGIFHDNQFNHYNLACDIMEPFRILVDRVVYSFGRGNFDREQKRGLLDILNSEVTIDNRRQTVINASRVYSRGIFDALSSNDITKIKVYRR